MTARTPAGAEPSVRPPQPGAERGEPGVTRSSAGVQRDDEIAPAGLVAASASRSRRPRRSAPPRPPGRSSSPCPGRARRVPELDGHRGGGALRARVLREALEGWLEAELERRRAALGERAQRAHGPVHVRPQRADLDRSARSRAGARARPGPSARRPASVGLPARAARGTQAALGLLAGDQLAQLDSSRSPGAGPLVQPGAGRRALALALERPPVVPARPRPAAPGQGLLRRSAPGRATVSVPWRLRRVSIGESSAVHGAGLAGRAALSWACAPDARGRGARASPPARRRPCGAASSAADSRSLVWRRWASRMRSLKRPASAPTARKATPRVAIPAAATSASSAQALSRTSASPAAATPASSPSSSATSAIGTTYRSPATSAGFSSRRAQREDRAEERGGYRRRDRSALGPAAHRSDRGGGDDSPCLGSVSHQA